MLGRTGRNAVVLLAVGVNEDGKRNESTQASCASETQKGSRIYAVAGSMGGICNGVEQSIGEHILQKNICITYGNIKRHAVL